LILKYFIHHYFTLTSFIIIKAVVVVAFPASVLFVFFWQNIAYAGLKREERVLSIKKERLVRRNNELKVNIASSASAERMETLYKKVYNYLPSPTGTRIITLTLPDEQEVLKKQ
jgi:hypothetical protein